MNTSDIRRALTTDQFAKHYLTDVYSYDQVIKAITNRDNTFYVFNTKPQLLPGEHWMAMGIRNGELHYFDSFGRHPGIYPELCNRLVELFPSVLWNDTPFQNPSTTACGDYCVVFGLLFSRGWNLQDYDNWLGLFPNTDIRDHALRTLTTNIYGNTIHSSYQGPSNALLTGKQNLHVSRIANSLAKHCMF